MNTLSRSRLHEAGLTGPHPTHSQPDCQTLALIIRVQDHSLPEPFHGVHAVGAG